MQETTSPPEDRPQKLRLTCDTMLGKLCRELRALGVDAEYRRGIGGLRAYKQARAKDQLFLTRAGRLRELPGAFYVESNDPAAQLVQVREQLGIEAGSAPASEAPASAPAAEKPAAPPPPSGSRCRDCNVALEKISREQARPAIPFFIYQIHHDFSRCPKCKRVFWPGSHTRGAQERAPARPRPRRGRCGAKK
ncbi:MAG TPA: hypothetical protein ENN51_01660 [candidate division WOR-3 bacterium]|uniref:Mut7-C RNAse domain-containing protein n=1 Tax=candidate division WOR-3 bacterium TaxID=2052148 RepID=A0A7V0T4X7_UNCW3|nr:hypothetical protein [candidate division WOR-3 bacterium]